MFGDVNYLRRDARGDGAMPRFYFDVVVNGEKSPDPKGLILKNAEEAHREGLNVVKILGREKAGDAAPADCELEILDGHRKLLVKLPFSMP
jgi:hypothetical protein